MRGGQQGADARAVAVLAAALQSQGRATRRRAVAMLAHVSCEQRLLWLEVALSDNDEGVRSTALAVIAWVLPVPEPPWPMRESWDHEDCESHVSCDSNRLRTPGAGGGWEYVVEVWRSDGLLIGAFAVTTCGEDDSHACSIALGQAILANTGRRGDEFDPATAAMFIVGKTRQAEGRATRARRPPGRSDGRRA